MQGDRHESNFITPAPVIGDAMFPPVFSFEFFCQMSRDYNYMHSCLDLFLFH